MTIAVQLVGVWKLAAYVDEHEGHPDVYPLSTEPQGFLIYTPDGFVSAQLMKPGRSRFASLDWHQGTPQEYREAGSGYIGYTGTYEVDEGAKTVTHIPQVALLPNLIHGRQLRSVTLSGDKLTLRVTRNENGASVSSRLEWQRTGKGGR